MTIQEALEYGKNVHARPRATKLSAHMVVDELPCNEVTSLFVTYDYDGELPDLSCFPKLSSFTCLRPVDMEYIAKQDLTKINKLSVNFKRGAGAICILAPALEELDIRIEDNDDAQLDFFTCADNSIVLSNMPYLRNLTFWKCSWHKVIITGIMPAVERLAFCNQDGTDFSMLKAFPNLKNLTVTGCGCQDVKFAKDLINLTKLDVSYNYIEDITPLLGVPALKEVNMYRNLESNAHLLRERGCKVIVTEADKSFERFKESLRTEIALAYGYLVRSRRVDPSKGSLYYESIARQTDEELFLWYFTSSVAREIKRFEGKAANGFNRYFPLPREKLIAYVREEYPFVDI